MKIFIRVTLILLLYSLNSCTNYNSTTLSKEAFAVCTASCDERAKQCNTTCVNTCQQCVAKERQSTAADYLSYQHEKQVEGGVIARQLNSYRDPLQCRKTTCNCRADYHVCMQSCGGVIHKQLRVAPVCQ